MFNPHFPTMLLPGNGFLSLQLLFNKLTNLVTYRDPLSVPWVAHKYKVTSLDTFHLRDTHSVHQMAWISLSLPITDPSYTHLMHNSPTHLLLAPLDPTLPTLLCHHTSLSQFH